MGTLQLGLGPVPGGCRPRVVCGVPAGSTGPGERSSSFLRLLKTPSSAGRSAEPPSRLSLPFLPFSVSSLTKDHRKRPKYNKLLVSTWGPSCPAPALLRTPAHLDTQGLGEASQEAALVLSFPPWAPQEHSFIKRYETLEVDVASWFKDVMAKTESPRTSGVLSQHHLPFFR